MRICSVLQNKEIKTNVRYQERICGAREEEEAAGSGRGAANKGISRITASRRGGGRSGREEWEGGGYALNKHLGVGGTDVKILALGSGAL